MLIIPAYLGAAKFTDLAGLCHSVLHSADKTVDCDAANLRFVDPLALCMLAATCHQVSARGTEVVLHNLRANMQSYLSRMDLFAACGIGQEPSAKRHNRRSVLVEIRRIEDRSQIEVVASQLADAIVGVMPGVDFNAPPDEMTGFKPHEHLTMPINYIFTELLENALTHGRRNGYGEACVWVASQYYASSDIVRLAIVDNGCGYLQSLTGHSKLTSPTHMSAIEAALTADVSCNKDVGLTADTINQGIGLTVVNDLAVLAEGQVRISSGDAVLSTSGDITIMCECHDWQGVNVSLEIPRNSLNGLNIRDVIQNYQHDQESPKITFL